LISADIKVGCQKIRTRVGSAEALLALPYAMQVFKLVGANPRPRFRVFSSWQTQTLIGGFLRYRTDLTNDGILPSINRVIKFFNFRAERSVGYVKRWDCRYPKPFYSRLLPIKRGRDFVPKAATAFVIELHPCKLQDILHLE